MQVRYPQPGWAEQSAVEIWHSVRQVIAEIVARVGAERIDALALSNQRESIVLWDAETGEPIAPAIIWQCRRSAARCAAIREACHEPEIVARTGLSIDPLFPAARRRIAPALRREPLGSGGKGGSVILTKLARRSGGGEHRRQGEGNP